MAAFTHVNALLHFDGANNSTSFVDSSLYGKIFSSFNGAKISTAQSLFGGASGFFDGVDDYISSADHADWDVLGSKTIDIAFRTSSASGATYTKGICGTGTFGSSAGWCIGHYLGNLSVRVNSTSYAGAGTVSVDTWHRVRLVWNQPANTFKVFLDGVQIYSGTFQTVTTSTALIIGNVSPVDANRHFHGHVDEFRVTNDVARSSANYTVDAAAFPDDNDPPSAFIAVADGPLGAPAVFGRVVYSIGDIGAFENELMDMTTGLGPDGFVVDWAIEPPLVTLIGFGATSSGDDGDQPQYIRGHVRDYDGIGVARPVYAVRRSDGAFMGRTVSAPDGSFTLRPRTTEPVILIAVPSDEEHINAVVLDNILPVPD